MVKNKNDNPFKKLNGFKIVLPAILGLGVVIYMIGRKFDVRVFDAVSFTAHSVLFIAVAAMFMMMRDIGYMIRIRLLTNKDLTWKKAFRVIMLWEFTSAVTPSAVGGTSLAILYVNKEGISLGRSSSVVLATSFLDELYFVIMFPILLLTINMQSLFAVGEIAHGVSFKNEFFLFAVIGYSAKLIYTIFVSYGLFVNPRGLKWLLLWIFKLPFLRRWRYEAHVAGSEIISSSKELKQKKIGFWLKAFGATFFSWTSRYWVVNAIMLAFFVVPDHLLIFARQLVMWIMMLVMPTPGGSGFSEYFFTEYMRDFIQVDPTLVVGVAAVLALLWRLLSYYPYLIIGSIILPKWINEKFTKKEIASDTQQTDAVSAAGS